MKIEIISKKLIKPLTPTPPNLKNYHFSFMDQHFSSDTVLSVVLFYQSMPENNTQLQESLAKILVQFYPLAGRCIRDDLIDCSDEGAMFVEAEAIDVEMKSIIDNHNVNNLFPLQDSPSDAPNPLLSIQVTRFPSGGLAIAFAVCHRVFDGSSLGTFIAAWSNATNPDGKIMATPSFDLPSLVPYKNRDQTNPQTMSAVDYKMVIKRFMFDKVAIMRLRSKLSPNRKGNTVSRVRAVSAAIANALIRLEHGKCRDFMLVHMINMRERTITPQPKHACGNLIIPSLTRRVVESEGKEFGMQELADLMGDTIEKTIADHAEMLSPDRDQRDIIFNTWENSIQQLSNPDINFITFTDWSKFGLNEADFGWGKPIWVGIGPLPMINGVVLMSNREGDGIEAWMYLNADDMHYFEQDEEIKYITT